MTTPLSQDQIRTINSYDQEQRLRYCIKEIVAQRQVWILTDEHGCVMLNSDEDECVPVWPNKEFAEEWATGDWQECQAESISLNKWHSRWTQGLEEDQLSVAVFPSINEEGMILFPDEFDFELKKQAARK